MDSAHLLLHRYRHDRRKLLEYLLSSGLIIEIRTPFGPSTSLSNLNLDAVSTDYVLECIQSGGVLDISRATKRYYEESARPMMMNLHSRDNYFLLSDTEVAGSPPRRAPPPIMASHSGDNQSRSVMAGQKDSLSGMSFKEQDTLVRSKVPDSVNNANSLTLALPTLRTGLSDDDLLDTAYEVLLVCMLLSGVEVQAIEGRKEKSSKILAVLKNKKDKRHLQSQSSLRQPGLIDIIRVQMQISESKGAVLRRLVVRSASVQDWENFDLPHISLGLLNGGYRSDFLTEKLYFQWKNRHANILEELLSSADSMVTEEKPIKSLLSKIRNSEDGEVKMSYSERSGVLTALRQVSLKCSAMPARFGIRGETNYWFRSYHLNLRIYERLLFSVFDTLEDGQLIEEAEELLNAIKLTWPILGIIQKLHNALYGWVLFQQFVMTEEPTMLDYAIAEVQRVLSFGERNEKEEEYMDNLLCFMTFNGCERKLTIFQSILLSISLWCDKKLQDYHLHFDQKAPLFTKVMKMMSIVGTYGFNKCSNIKSKESDASRAIAKKVKRHVIQSVEAICKRVIEKLSMGSDMDMMHPLALLASELRLIVEKELSVYYPVLCQWCPRAGMVTAVKLHQFYGERLRPYLNSVSCLSADVREVLPAADRLERCLLQLYSSACKEEASGYLPKDKLELFKIGEISQPIILDWIISQHSQILEWIGRSFDLEEWEPLSSQQKQAASAVEVFRIIEETVDQFFELNLPMDITHLQALLSIIFHTLDAYLQQMIGQFGSVDKQNLYPPLPPLTRYTEAAFPLIKRKLVDCVVLEDEVNEKLSRLTASKLCIRLNTLQYIQKQISGLEDNIRRSWISIPKFEHHTRIDGEVHNNLFEAENMYEDSIAELFVATFDCLRDAAADAARKICDFIGARVVFWDLRAQFLYRLYHGGVVCARLDGLLSHLDSVLNSVCSLIDDTLRDNVASSILTASLEGYVWVLLDGGPTCAFSDSDIPMMEEDLNLLKDLFVADGEGLPRSLVEVEAKFAHQVLDLYSLQSESLIHMLRASSEKISIGLDARKGRKRVLHDAHTLVRVLCHKKDREASKFLKQHYQLPASSEYHGNTSEDSSTKSPVMADVLKRSASFHWTPTGHSSFKSIRKRFQEATSDLRHAAW